MGVIEHDVLCAIRATQTFSRRLTAFKVFSGLITALLGVE